MTTNMATKGNYYISKNDTLGRYMRAGKNVKAGELILSEKPTLVGPPLGGPLICFNCCRNITKRGYIYCMGCKTALICSPKCTGNLHNSEECAVLKDKKINGNVLADNSQLTFPLRCLLIRDYDREKWDSVMKLESHLESRRNTPVWRRYMITVEKVLRGVNFISDEDLTQELVQTVCGILDVNTFEVRSPESNAGLISNPEIHCLRGLYLEAALMAHDCVGNTHLSVDEDFVLSIHASIDIPENSPIFFNYSNVLQGNALRKQHLREGKYFECVCERCKDPTELGTELSSLKCHVCRKGLIRPSQSSSDWKCSECQKTFKDFLINSATREGRRRIEDVDQSNVKDMENLLKTLLQTFHQNHYLVLELQQNLIGLYLQLAPTKQNLSRKIYLCNGLLEVFYKIELGLSRLKAITFYELQSAMIDLAHKQYRDKEISIDDLITQLLSAESILKEAIKNLLYEPPKSPEGRLAQRALSELKNLRISMKNMQKDLLCSNAEPKTRKALPADKVDIKTDTKQETCVEKNHGNNKQKETLDNKKETSTRKMKKNNKRRK